MNASVILLCLLLLSALGNAQIDPESPYDANSALFTTRTQQTNIGFNWPLSISPESASHVPTAAVIDLLHTFYDDPSITIDAGEFVFVQMDRGLPVLAIRPTYDEVRSRLVDLVRCLGVVCTTWGLSSSELVDIDEQFFDFEGNGFKDLIVANPLNDTDQISVFRVYRMINGDLVDITKGNKKAAPKLLTLLEQQKSASDESTVEPQSEGETGDTVAQEVREELRLKPVVWKAQNVYARDDYDRIVLERRSSGFEHAMTWKRSDIRDIRLLAVHTFEQIATVDAINQLIEMTKANDGWTADEARRAMERIQLRNVGYYLK
jgi:hypothetical protein